MRNQKKDQFENELKSKTEILLKRIVVNSSTCIKI